MPSVRGFVLIVFYMSIYREKDARVVCAGYGKDKRKRKSARKGQHCHPSCLLGKAVGVSMTKPSISIGSLCLISF